MLETQVSAEEQQVFLETSVLAEEALASEPRSATLDDLFTRGTAREEIIPMQAKGTKQPFFYLHGDWTGNAFYCFRLASLLGSSQPFYLLTPYDFDGLDVLPTTQEMAAAHLSSLRSIQPNGPYQLGGFCNGGLLAYEMARQLHALGEQVSLLVLIDPIPPRTQAICAKIRHYGSLVGLSQSKQLDIYLRMEHAYRYLFDKHADDFEYIKQSDPRISAYFPPVKTLRKEYPALFTWATSNYHPSYYPGKVVLFWDEAELFRRKWWHRWARGQNQAVEEYIIPGTHFTCKTEHLEGMAQCLSTCMSQVQSAAVL